MVSEVTVLARRVDPSALDSVSHHTDTHISGVHFFRKKKLCFLSVFPLFLSLVLSFSVHTVWVLFCLINLTKVSCEG